MPAPIPDLPPCERDGRPTRATLNRLLVKHLADPARVSRLLASGADPETCDPNGCPVLEVALTRNLAEVVQLLRDTIECRRRWQQAPR